MSLTKIVNMVGIELEGGWNTDTELNCNHTCDDDCTSLVCRHDCFEEDSCWQLKCTVDIEDCICDNENTCQACHHKEAHEARDGNQWRYSCFGNSYSLKCWQRKCDHDHTNRCYESDCCHDCEDDCYAPRNIEGFHYDGSVGTDAVTDGEVASRPFSDLNQMKAWIAKNAPEVVNSSCGTHIHVSLNRDEDYDILLNNELDFYRYFLENVEIWGKANLRPNNNFWKRFRGENHYCHRNDIEDCDHGSNYPHKASKQEPRADKGCARYAHINFCRKLHGTIEFRIFHGMKTPDLIMTAVQVTIDIVDSYLSMFKEQQTVMNELAKTRHEDLICA